MITTIYLALLAIVGFVAAVFQDLDPSEAIGRLNAIWLIIGGFIPFVYPFFVRANAGKLFKVVLSLGLSVVAALLTLIPQGGFTDMSVSAIIVWAFGFIGVVQAVYAVANPLVETATGSPLKAKEIYRPESGLG